MHKPVLALLLATLFVAPIAGHAQAQGAYSPEAGWSEFEQVLRERYAYFQRPDVDGEVILSRFRTAALAASSREALVDVIQQAAMNFADPHLTVGPFVGAEASLIPTGSDIHARWNLGAVAILDVRSGSDAARQGLRRGDIVTMIDGRTPADAIVHVLGTPLHSLSDAQLDHGLNMALAGIFGAPRTISVVTGGQERTVSLAPVSAMLAAMRRQPLLEWRQDGRLAIVRFNNSLGDNATIAAFRESLPRHLDAAAILIDLRNTPSGGNTTVARAIMGAFTACTRPYQQHDYIWETRTFGVPRQAVELVLPGPVQFSGRVYVASGPWTGSMGEGLTIGLDALGATTVGGPMGDLLGGIENVDLEASGARLDLPVERLLHVDGTPREDFVPRLTLTVGEARADGSDPVVQAVQSDLQRLALQTPVDGRPLVWPGYRPCQP
jgi:carboxyl-terminal processing protease